MKNPKARRTQLLSTFGVGGLFPAENTSFMIRGLDDWPEDRYGVEVSEPRLARSLGVRELRLPPAGTERDVPVVRFPETQVCSKCHRIGSVFEFGSLWNESVCKLHPGRTPLAPFRLVTCCTKGHIDEFPIFRWLHVGEHRSDGTEHKMSLTAAGTSSSLGDMRLSCSCDVPEVNLDGAFEPKALAGILKCKGRRPWLGPAHSQECTESPRTVQRGASNVWFPAVRSSISIPPFSEAVARFVDRHWKFLEDPEALTSEPVMKPVVADARGRFSRVEIEAEVRRRHAVADDEGPLDDQGIRVDEYKALLEGRPEGSADADFVALHVDPPAIVDGLVDHVRQVTRLREVRALFGFSRLSAVASESEADRLSALSIDKPTWFPAIQVIGEGIFLGFSQERLADWAGQDWVAKRVELLRRSAARAAARYKRPFDKDVNGVQVALHTLAHVLIDQVSLDAGYPAASIRERLYLGPEMAGILIYTASSDSAGSLGGLAAHASEHRLGHALSEGLVRLQWCSADPVCIETTSGGSDGLNLAACHACVLVPETSCEHNNSLLDRGLLFGMPVGEGLGRGLFSRLLGLEPTDYVDAPRLEASLVGPEWARLAAAALSDKERAALHRLARLGAPLPVQGHEVDGAPLDLAWPDRRVAIVFGPVDTDEWDILPIDATDATIKQALGF